MNPHLFISYCTTGSEPARTVPARLASQEKKAEITRSVLSLICLCLFLASASPAQNQRTVAAGTTATFSMEIPRLVRFSGTVRDAEGNPKSGVAGITFALYKDQQGGATLWQETQNVHADSAGKYTVLLGSASAEGLPMDIFTSNDARWLGIRVEDQAEQPRTLLVSAPYALKAGDAETLGGKPLSAFQLVAPESSSGSVSASPAAAEQGNEITCASGTGCRAAFVPLFTSNGGSAKVSDSVISQIGSTVNVSGEVTGLTGFFTSSNSGAIFQATNGGAGSGVAGNGVTGVSGFGFSIGKTFGVEGLSLSSNGTGLWGLGQGQSHIGQHVGCCGPVGVWGDTSSNASGAAGLVGTADDGFALVVENNSTTHLTASITNDTPTHNIAILTVNAPGTQQFCNINTNGVLFARAGIRSRSRSTTVAAR
jgi:hypothetical protein